MKTILSFILLQFITIVDGTIKEKLLSSSVIAFILTPFVFLIDKLSILTIQNSTYITFVCVAILIDWFFGTIKHFFYTRTFSWRNNDLLLVNILLFWKNKVLQRCLCLMGVAYFTIVYLINLQIELILLLVLVMQLILLLSANLTILIFIFILQFTCISY